MFFASLESTLKTAEASGYKCVATGRLPLTDRQAEIISKKLKSDKSYESVENQKCLECKMSHVTVKRKDRVSPMDAGEI